jgi:hypothetical protein
MNLGEEYIQNIKERKHDTISSQSFHTIWSALHNSLGGGWVHFTNCLLYALETEQLSLKEPLLKRPETNWKPNPITESYKRTRKWKYYFPMDQKLAQKEYKLREKEGKLGDIHNLPESFIPLVLETSQGDYNKLVEERDLNKIAKINIVKIILGANYIGEAQINFIRSTVLNSIKSYNIKKLPTVIVFDEFHAAAIMSMDLDGYKVENIVFREESTLNDLQREEKTGQIENIIADINKYNRNAFQKRLGEYYAD